MEQFIGYDELTPECGYPRLKESLADGPYPGKEAIVWFLQNGKEEFVRMSYMRDIFTGKYIPREVIFMTSGKYGWSSILAYYVEKYNLRLPPHFEAYILKTVKDKNGFLRE